MTLRGLVIKNNQIHLNLRKDRLIMTIISKLQPDLIDVKAQIK